MEFFELFLICSGLYLTSTFGFLFELSNQLTSVCAKCLLFVWKIVKFELELEAPFLLWVEWYSTFLQRVFQLVIVDAILTCISLAFWLCIIFKLLIHFLQRIHSNETESNNSNLNTDPYRRLPTCRQKRAGNLVHIDSDTESDTVLELDSSNTKKHKTDRTEDNSCVVCLDRQRNTAVFPCGHAHMCTQCVEVIMNKIKRCPTCQSRIQEYRRIYL